MGLVGAAAVAVAVFTLPGFVLNWVSGARGPWSVAAAAPVTFGVYGFSAWYFGTQDIRYDVRHVAMFWAVILLVAVLWRLSFFAYRRRAQARLRQETAARETDSALDTAQAPAEPAAPRSMASWRVGTFLDPIWLLPGVGAAAGIAILLVRSLGLLSRATHGMDNIYQGWDVHWHASVIEWIGKSGIASSTRMGELQNTELQTPMYYPAAWHAGGALLRELTGISAIAATNLTALVLPAIVLPLSVAALAWRMVDGRGLTAQIAAGLAPLIVPGLPVLYWIGLYVGAWPYVAAMAASGIVVGIFMSVPYSPIRCFAAALSLVGLVQLHPSAVTIPVMALALWWLTKLLWRPARRPQSWKGRIGCRLRDVALLAATGGVGALTLLPQLLLGAEQSEDVKSFTALEDLDRKGSWETAIYMLTRHAGEFRLDVRAWVWLAAAGAVLLLLWRRNLWAPIFWFLSVWITTNSLQPFGGQWADWLGTVGALHYNTAHRLVMPGAMFVAASAAAALAILIRLVTLAPVKKLAYPAAVASLILAIITGAVVQQVVRTGIERGSQWAINSARDERMVNSRDLKAFDWLAQQPHAYEGAIFTNPDEGSGWMYAYNGLPAVFKHYLWPSTTIESATNRLFWHPMRLGAGNFDQPNEANMVDTAAQELHVNFIYISPPHFWGFQLPRPDMEEGLMTTPGVTPVYRDKEIGIYAVNAAFTDEELLQMRKNTPSPDPLPPLKTKAELGLATDYENYSDFDVPYFQRPTIPNRGRDSHFEWLQKQKPNQPPAPAPEAAPSPADAGGNAQGQVVLR